MEDMKLRLTFVPKKSGVPPAARFRQLLKYALRSQDLRCVRVEDAARVEPVVCACCAREIMENSTRDLNPDPANLESACSAS